MCFIILRYDCFTLLIQIFLLQTYLLVILSSFHGGDLCDSFEVVAVTLISHFSLFFFTYFQNNSRRGLPLGSTLPLSNLFGSEKHYRTSLSILK